MRAKESARLKPLRLTIFASFPDPYFQEIGTKISLACTASNPHYRNVYREKHSLARVLFCPSPRRIDFCGSEQRGSVSADGSELCTTRLRCNFRHNNLISSKSSNFLSQYSRGNEIYSSKTLRCSRLYSIEMLLGYTAQNISKAWTAFVDAASRSSLPKLVSPYIFSIWKRIDFLN